MNKWLVGLACAVVGAATAWGQSVVINEIRNDAPDAVELVVVQDGLNMQGMIVKDYSSSGANDGGGAFTFSTDPLWASLPAGTIIVLQKTNTATDVTVGGGDYNLTVGLQNATYFTAGSGTFDIATEEIIQIKAAGNDQAGSTGAIHTLATDGAGAQYDSSPTPKLKAASGDSGFPESVEANNSTAALSDFNGTDATGDNATGTLGTYNNANNQTFIDGLRGPATFGVTFDKATGFEVEQGTTEVLTATAANGTAPYGYAWSSSLGGAYYATNANEFTIQSTAPLGDYSAQVIATDATAASVTNTIAFSVVAPAVTYAIAIVTNDPANGTVTTTPATEAEAGQTVTVNASPFGGYAVQSIVVNGGAVTVTGTTFTMPAEAVVVTVTFGAVAAEGIVDFRFNAAPYLQATAKDANLTVSDMALTAGTIETNITTGSYFTDEPYVEETGGWGVSNQVGSKAYQFTITPAEGASVTIEAISFKAYATAAGPSAYGIDVGGLASYSGDAPSGSLLVVSQAVAGVVGQTGAIVVSIQGWANGSRETAGTGVLRLDDVVVHGTVSTGPLEFSVSFNKLSGFTVEQGVADAVTATAAHGTAPYGYSWSSTLGSDYYEANAGVFTILDTAPVGDYSAQVVATDSSDPVQNVTNSLDFSVVAPPTKYAISIVTNAPANGTVATTPATEAVAGATVTVNATPAGGYAVESIAVNGGAVTVTGNTFVMPAEPVVVTVTFAEHVGSNLIISEVTDPADVSNAKFVEIYNAGGASIDLSAGQWYLSRQANGGNWASVALTGTVGAAQTHMVIYSVSNFSAAYPAATYQQVSGNVLTGNGDDGYFLYSGGSNTVGTLEDAYGVLNEDGTGKPWEYEDARAARNAGVTAGNPTWTASEWTLTDPANVADMTPGVHPDGPVVFGVTFDKASGFTVEQGASDAITATAANGTAPYGYSWSSTLGGTHYSAIDNVFTILATAPIGDYSATVTATDDAAQTASNTVTFSVVAPPTKYAISIVTNAPANGTVTTTPATEAAAGATVTVNATPAGGYAVESIVVNGGAVTVTGNTFVMPAEPATVTVAFMEYTAPDVLITFETGTLPSAYAANTATLEDGKVWSTMRVVKSNSDNDKKIDTLSARLYPQTGTNAVLQQTEAYAEPISEISYWVASYGSDNMANVTLAVEVSSDGTNWETAETLTGADDITATLTEHVVATVPANAVYVRFVATAEAASNKRINLDNIGFNMGTASFGVSLNKSNGFEVQEGQSDSIIATAANGTTPYSYEWDSTLGATFYNASGDAFTILATAPTGSYSATVTATDAALATAQKTVTFSVVGLGPGPAVIIAGSRTGTVGVPMELTISVTNETAEEWFVDLKDPTGADAGWDYANFPPTFSMTPTMTGTYVLVVTAQTGSGNVTNTANLVIGAGDGGEHPSIPAITFVAGTGFNFPLPDGHTVSRMEAAGTATDANGEFIWSAFTDYTVDGSTVTINSAGAAARMIRVWFN